MEKWEYLMVELKLVDINAHMFSTVEGFDKVWSADLFTEHLNQYGELGWELVSCFPIAGFRRTIKVFASFKRKKL